MRTTRNLILSTILLVVALGSTALAERPDNAYLITSRVINTDTEPATGEFLVVQSDGTLSWSSTIGGDLTVSGDPAKITLDDAAQQDYDISTDTGTSLQTLVIRGKTSGTGAGVHIFNADADGTDSTYLELWSKGHGTSLANRERLQFEQGPSGALIHTEAAGSGTVRALKLYTGSNTSQLVLGNDGNVGLGTSSPDSRLNVAQGAAETTLNLDCYEDSNALRSRFQFRKSGSDTVGTDAATVDGEYLGSFLWSPNDGSSWNLAGGIDMIQVGAHGANYTGSKLQFSTCASGGGSAPAVAITIDADQDLILSSTCDLSMDADRHIYAGNNNAVGDPSYSFGSDSDTGMTRPAAADTLQLVTGGAARLTADASGYIEFDSLPKASGGTDDLRFRIGSDGYPEYSTDDGSTWLNFADNGAGG